MTHIFKPSLQLAKNWNDPIRLGNIQLKNRICMAALTRQRCNPANGIPNKLNLQYYSQRRGAGMILTQSTAYTKRGQFYPGAPGLYNIQQAEGWLKIVQHLHDSGTKIFIQLFHAGRVTHPKLNGGLQPFAPSAIRLQQPVKSLVNQYFPVPKAMTIEDIEKTKQQFEKSVKLAKQIDFDGIQYHASTGFLSDSFIRSKTNRRADAYGGSIENRCRFPLQMVDILKRHFSPERIGLKLSPGSRTHDIQDDDPLSTYSYLIKQLNKKRIGFLEMRELYHQKKNQKGVNTHQKIKEGCRIFRQLFDGVLIANDGFTPESGIEKIKNNQADMISFGRLYISNPDLAERIINNKIVNYRWNAETFYGYHHGAKGYTDYERFKE